MRTSIGLLFLAVPLLTAADTDWATLSDADLLARYQELRAVGLDSSRVAVAENLTFEKGGATFHLINGNLYFFQPVNGTAAGAVFVGEGRLSLKPPDEMERNQLRRFLDGDTELDEPFNELVLIATDDTLSSLSANLKLQPGTVPPKATDILNDFRKTYRDDIRMNVEARIVAGLCSPRDPLFLADLDGKKHGRLMFAVDTQSEDEVQLAHYKGKNVFDTWTAYHLPSVPDSTQRALIDTIRTKIDVSVEKSKRLGGTEEIEFSSLAGGPRLLLVQLAPTLRVSKISSEGAELKFIQEDKKKDASLWVITPKPLAKGQHCVWTIAYSGDEVISNAGEGNYFVGRRTSWYPKLDIPGDLFGDRAIYQLRFQSPKGFDLIATGKLKNRSEQGKLVITEWETEIPFPVVGFNFGRFKSLSKAADSTEISVYVNPGLNDELQGIRNLIEHNPEAAKAAGMMSGGLNTTGMLGAALAEAYNAVRLFTIYFGPLPFSNVSLSQQPSSSYGQSWPTLIFLPYTAFLDATTRNQLGLDDSRSERQFFEQVGPHEMAHQWWAHTVGTKSYHDEWLSEGFAEYSGGLYVQRVLGDKRFQAFLNAKREEILSPLPDTRIRANDAGPVYLGRRLSSEKTPGAYSRIVYAKGAFVLHMLRMLMYNFTSRDETPFITMMKEFTSTYRGRDASTEDFKAIVSKYFRGDMSWFFNQWVYGTEIPRITVQYSVVKNEKGALMQGTITQRGVSPGFQTFMPVLVTLGQKVGRVRLSMMGEVPAPISIQLPSVPDSVEFNPLESVLCDLEVKKM